MRPTSRRRRFVIRIGLSACLLVGGAWLLGLYLTIGWSGRGDRRGLSAHSGAVVVYWREQPNVIARPGWVAYVALRAPAEWVPKYATYRTIQTLPARTRSLSIPLWIPFALAAVPTLVYWRKRPPPGFCPACGYDLTGNVSGRCPECGVKV